MRNKGFTLIELLAVIVILAIIALIAVPMILNVISAAQTNSDNESIDLYRKAINQAVARYKLNNNQAIIKGDFVSSEDGKTLTQESSGITLTIDYDGSRVKCETVQVKDNGIVYLQGCTVNSKAVEVTKACTLTDVNSNKIADVGEMVTCGSESFYVMPDHENAPAGTVSMMAQYNITATTTNPVQDPTDTAVSSKNPVAFSSSSYWGSVSDGTFVYNDSASISTYVNAYKETLKGKGLSNDIILTLPSYNQLTDSSIGCSSSDLSCRNASSWVYSTTYWTGSASDANRVWYVISNGGFNNYYVNYSFIMGVRPVIIVSESEIGVS